MQTHEIIARLAETSGRIEKEQILFDAFMRGHRELFIACRLAYDPLITFGVAKVTRIEEEGETDLDAGNLPFPEFMALADKLRKRELTGHAARDAINEAALKASINQWNGFYRRILLKDLKAGFESNTVNKILTKIGDDAKNFVIPIFSCQLAHDGADDKHAKKIETGTWMLDRKLDGARLLTVLDKETGTVTQYTRNGKVNENFVEITTALKKTLDLLPGSVVLDGEVVSSSFQDLMTQINRKSEKSTGKARLALFDVIPLNDFRSGLCSVPQIQRHEHLTELTTSGLLKETTGELVYTIPKITVDLDTEEGRAQFSQFNREMVEQGFEGIMCKRPSAPYRTKRTDDWLKVKPFLEVSLEIVDVEEGKADGKYAGMLGALVCRGEDDGRMIETNVGSGLTDAQRVDFWARRESLKGMIVEVRADALTLESGATVYSMRFPRYKGFRGTVPGEKL